MGLDKQLSKPTFLSEIISSFSLGFQCFPNPISDKNKFLITRAPIVLLSIHTVSCPYFCTSDFFVQYLIFKHQFTNQEKIWSEPGQTGFILTGHTYPSSGMAVCAQRECHLSSWKR